MSKFKQKIGEKGSLKWIQTLINDKPEIIDTLIANKFEELATEKIKWLSPLKNDGYAEYRDSSFIKLVGLDPIEIQLEKFWPKRGPQWDALGVTENKRILLVEAKANTRELESGGTRAKEISKQLIDESLAELKEFLDIINDVNWSAKYYQYTNRLANLYYLREKCNVEAYLVNIYFINDITHIAKTEEEFELALKKLKKRLGIEINGLQRFISEIFIDVSELGIRN